MKWFGNSKVVDRQGRPLRMYHGTTEKFDTFHPLSHFGTAKAANHRLRDRYAIRGDFDSSHIIPVYLRIENPLKVNDMEAAHEPALLNAIARGKYPDIDVNTARRQGIRRALKDAEYDGLVYWNRLEDRGKYSWVILNPDQVRSAFAIHEDVQSPGLTRDDLAMFEDHIRAAYDLTTFNLMLDYYNNIHLTNIVVRNKKQGTGTAVMNELAKFADAHGARIILSPGEKRDGTGTTSRNRLVRFYRRFGFLPNKGRHKDFRTLAGMIRRPVGTPTQPQP